MRAGCIIKGNENTTMKTMQNRPSVVDMAAGYSKMMLPVTCSPNVKYPVKPTTMNNAASTAMATKINTASDGNDLFLDSLIMENMF